MRAHVVKLLRRLVAAPLQLRLHAAQVPRVLLRNDLQKEMTTPGHHSLAWAYNQVPHDGMWRPRGEVGGKYNQLASTYI